MTTSLSQSMPIECTPILNCFTKRTQTQGSQMQMIATVQNKLFTRTARSLEQYQSRTLCNLYQATNPEKLRMVFNRLRVESNKLDCRLKNEVKLREKKAQLKRRYKNNFKVFGYVIALRIKLQVGSQCELDRNFNNIIIKLNLLEFNCKNVELIQQPEKQNRLKLG